MPSDNEKSSVNNNHQVVLLSDDVRRDIKELALEVRSGYKEVTNHLIALSDRMTRMEAQQQRVEILDKEFKEHVQVMNPIREDVVTTRRIGMIALTAAGAFPALLSAFFSMWHPWSDDTRAQLAPLVKQINEIQDRERSDMAAIQSSLQDQNYKITTLQSELPAPSSNLPRKR